MAPTYALRVSASAETTECIIVLNALVSVSTSRVRPVSGIGLSKSREAVIAESDVESRSMGREIVRASQTLAIAANRNDPIAIASTAPSARRIGSAAEASIDPTA